jgi:hypothetical protein
MKIRSICNGKPDTYARKSRAYKVLVQPRGLTGPRDQRKKQEDFRSRVNRRTAEDTFPTHELDGPLEWTCAVKEYANL